MNEASCAALGVTGRVVGPAPSNSKSTTLGLAPGARLNESTASSTSMTNSSALPLPNPHAMLTVRTAGGSANDLTRFAAPDSLLRVYKSTRCVCFIARANPDGDTDATWAIFHLLRLVPLVGRPRGPQFSPRFISCKRPSQGLISTCLPILCSDIKLQGKVVRTRRRLGFFCPPVGISFRSREAAESSFATPTSRWLTAPTPTTFLVISAGGQP